MKTTGHPSDRFITLARTIQSNARAPYSKFKVGAILVSDSGKIYSGCNIENSSYSLTICAERVAIFKAISEGETTFTDLYLCGDAPTWTHPCGACRQVLMDLAGPDLAIHLIHRDNSVRTVTCSDLLPDHFSATDLPL